jgi:hypothetical protein
LLKVLATSELTWHVLAAAASILPIQCHAGASTALEAQRTQVCQTALAMHELQ